MLLTRRTQISLSLLESLTLLFLTLCGQVSWHWRSIVELDQLWMPKCLRLGWCISFSPTAFEQGVWKRHYIQTVQELRLASLQVRRSHPELVQTRVRTEVHEKCSDKRVHCPPPDLLVPAASSSSTCISHQQCT